mgnify:CR=1 FL=1
MEKAELQSVILEAVRLTPRVKHYLSPEAQAFIRKARAEKADGDLSGVNRDYHDAIAEALIDYFESGGSVTGPRNAMIQAMVEAFGDAFDNGWQDGGGEMPPDEGALDWFNPRVEEETGHIKTLFQQAKELRNDPDADWMTWVTERADSYTKSIGSVYNAGVMLAKKNQMLTWHLGNTEKHCTDCSKLDGGSHRASWYLARDYIPRKPGASMECGGYNCDCSLTDRDGNEITI